MNFCILPFLAFASGAIATLAIFVMIYCLFNNRNTCCKGNGDSNLMEEGNPNHVVTMPSGPNQELEMAVLRLQQQNQNLLSQIVEPTNPFFN